MPVFFDCYHTCKKESSKKAAQDKRDKRGEPIVGQNGNDGKDAPKPSRAENKQITSLVL